MAFVYVQKSGEAIENSQIKTCVKLFIGMFSDSPIFLFQVFFSGINRVFFQFGAHGVVPSVQIAEESYYAQKINNYNISFA